MSAITGIFYRDGLTVNPKLIKKMNNKLSHRGHDGSAIWYDKQVALGHQMLFTTPESLHEKLPFHDKKTGLVITADARIDNRKELAEELDIENIVEVSDSYFILKSYEKWGEKCPEHLLGDFAFAIWDENEDKLFCARDHIGVKPFYYYLDDNMFVFGTEIKVLFCVPGVSYKLNENMIAQFLMVTCDDKSTFYENIFSFDPANSLTINKKVSKKSKYWELDQQSQIILDSEEDYINTFRDIFKEAVNCRLRSAYPVGFQLSGGLDSSSVLCMAKEILKQKKTYTGEINSYSFIFDDIPCDESFFIKKIINTGGINHTIILGDEISPLGDIEDILWFQEQPVFTPNIALLWNLYKKMQEKKIRVVLGGEGGDQVISHGNYYFRDLTIAWKWKKLFSEIYKHSKHRDLNIYKLLLNKVILPVIPEYLKSPIRPYYNQKSETFILNKDFSMKLNMENLEDIQRETITKNNTAKKDHYKTITQEILYPTGIIDKTTSAFSIEPRHPFLDKRLIEFCYGIPTDIKFKFGWNRYILRMAMTDILPKENQWRPDKTNLDPFYEKNLLLFEKDFLDQIINSNNIIIDYVDIEIIRDTYKKYKEGKADSDSIYWLWLISILILWLQK